MFSSKFRFGYIGLLAAYSYFNIKFTEGDQLLASYWPEWVLILAILATVMAIWEGDRLIFGVFEKRVMPKSKLLILMFVLSSLLVFVLAAVSFAIQNTIIETDSWLPFKLALGFGFRVNLFLNCINAIIFYHKKVASAELKAEQLKKETAFAQMDSLKRQVQPHFLFNSLNVLDSLIRSNPEQACIFLEKLANVYRYLSNIESQELVYVRDELSFVKDYIFLMETRFKDHLSVNIEVSDQDLDKLIPPSTLQLLLENAIKHNQISHKNHLNIKVHSHNGDIVTYNRKKLKKSDSSKNGVGLENIKSRYGFLNKVIEVIEDEDSFSVRVPLVN